MSLGKSAVSIVAFAIMLGGCGPADNTPAPENTQQPAVTSAVSKIAQAKAEPRDDSPVVAIINGRTITRKDVVRSAKVMLTLNMNKLRHTQVGKREKAFLSRYCTGAVKREVGREAVRVYLAEQKLKPTDVALKAAERQFTKTYGVRSKKLKRWHTIDDLKYMLGKNSFRLDREIEDLASFTTATNHLLTTHPVVVTDEDVQTEIKRVRDYNLTAGATNAFVFAEATNVWRDVQAKKISFEDAAAKFSQDMYISEGCEWGSFTADQLGSEETALKAHLQKMSAGEVTPPVESDGGLAIVRLDERDSEQIMTLSRIFFRLPMFFDVPSEEQARQDLKTRRELQVVNDTFEGLAKKFAIEYPNGKNPFVENGKAVEITLKELKDCDR